MSLNNPMVSICCLTYNHSAFISECLDGFLGQKTSFPFEILIHDDASTDGTQEIIKDYSEKYKDVIFPLFEKENQFSKYSGNMDVVFNYSRARGKYIAYCEGDDYWTDPLKLQKQVDFLESHPEYSVCFHRCSKLLTQTNEFVEDNCACFFCNGEDGVDITMDMFFNSWITQPLSMVFRRSSFDETWCRRYKYYRDMHEIYHLLNEGKGYLFSFNGGVYRYHSGGIHSMLSRVEYCNVSLPIDREFYRKTKVDGARQIYCETLQDAIAVNLMSNKFRAIWFALVQYTLSRRIKTLGKNISAIFHGHF